MSLPVNPGGGSYVKLPLGCTVTDPLTAPNPAALVLVATPTLAAKPCTCVTVNPVLFPVSGSTSLASTPFVGEIGMFPVAV